MDNHEEILDALTAFGKNPNPQEIPSVLEQYLNCVAKNGETLFPWTQLKPLILRKMELVITELRRSLASETIPNRPNVENVRFDVMHARIIDSLHKFNGAPFTIQRLCELLIDPKRHYKRSDKFMRGLEKNVLVVSTVDPFGRKVVCESGNKPILNGILDINGSYPPRDTALSVPLPPVPGWVTTTSPTSTAPSRTATTVPPSDTKVETGNPLESLNKVAEVVSNGVSGGVAVSSSVFTDQADPLAVQSEEVVEETVVTMDTSEVSSVVTDGGEAMAEGETMEGDIADDRDASSFSSSSSSSSEELSTSSDSISPFGVTVNNFNDEASLDENRPWAAFAQDVKQHEDITSHPSCDQQIKTVAVEDQISGASSSSSPPTTTVEASSSLSLSSSSEPQSSLLSTTTSSISEKIENQDSLNQTTSDQASWLPSEDSCEVNRSLGFEPLKSAPEHILSPAEDTANSLSEQDRQASSTTTHKTIPDPLSSAGVPTYAQVVSSTDKTLHLTPYDSTDTVPCDSVAGLERLVGSMEQSLSSSPSSSASIAGISSSSPSSSCLSSQPDVPPNINSVTTSTAPSSLMGSSQQALPSSSDCSSSEGEPVSKRLRLSPEEDMEEDCISTSGDSCMEGEDSGQTMEQQNKEPSVHSSVEGDIQAQKQEESPSVTDAPTGLATIEDAGEITEERNVSSDSSSSVNDDLKDNFENNVKSSSGMEISLNEETPENSVISDSETSVSTTNVEVEDQKSPQTIDNE